MLNTEQDSVKQYSNKTLVLNQEINDLSSRLNKLSFLRLGLMLTEIPFFIGLTSSTTLFWQLTFTLLLCIPVAIFIIVIRKQTALNTILAFKKNLLWVFENELAIVNKQANGYSNGQQYNDEQHAYQSDLDIFGPSSLFELVNRAVTTNGQNLLATNLKQNSSKSTILARQEAINEVVNYIDSSFNFRASLKGCDVNRIDELKYKIGTSLQQQVNFANKKGIRFFAQISPIITIIFLLIGLIFGAKLWLPFILMVVTNMLLNYIYSKEINTAYAGFSGTSTLLNGFAEAVAWSEQKSWKSPYIKNLFNNQALVSNKISALSKIIISFDARLNFLLFAVLNFFLLWDIKCCIKLANWSKSAGADVVDGLNRISSFEDLISFGTLQYNNPSWVVPKITDEFSLQALNLGHPLIPKANRVCNNYELKNQATVDIITGSNMAGKSTFLRTLGINMVLAYAGSAVCASQMNLSIFKLLTYMRIKDNLIESTSTFKAELNRLKMILENVATETTSFVLIDEMLRGTNSKDKFDGSKAFIEKLIGLKTATLFATHDLQLSELEAKYPNNVRNFHFDIQMQNEEMAFDFKIKDGPCKQFNAAILLKQIGLSLN